MCILLHPMHPLFPPHTPLCNATRWQALPASERRPTFDAFCTNYATEQKRAKEAATRAAAEAEAAATEGFRGLLAEAAALETALQRTLRAEAAAAAAADREEGEAPEDGDGSEVRRL